MENIIGEVQIKSGNSVSAGALATLGFWGIDCLVLTQRGNPVAILKSLSDDMHVSTRVAQYEAVKTDKGLQIAKNIVVAKIDGQNQVLKKYGLKRIDFSQFEKVKALQETDLVKLRRRLIAVEAHCSNWYFREIFGLFPESIRPAKRRCFKAYDGVNNLFNLAYEILRWKVHMALLRAELEPYLGFIHSLDHGMPSLVCDFQEIYRSLIDDLVIKESMRLRKKDLVLKDEVVSSVRQGKREYLAKEKNSEFIRKVNDLFRNRINVPRIRHGEKQEIETLISEEALLFAMYLRGEKPTWVPRVAELK